MKQLLIAEKKVPRIDVDKTLAPCIKAFTVPPRRIESARARRPAFYLCRPFCGTMARHLVFMATPRAATFNPRPHLHADTNPPAFHLRNSLVFVVHREAAWKSCELHVHLQPPITFLGRILDEHRGFRHCFIHGWSVDLSWLHFKDSLGCHPPCHDPLALHLVPSVPRAPRPRDYRLSSFQSVHNCTFLRVFEVGS